MWLILDLNIKPEKIKDVSQIGDWSHETQYIIVLFSKQRYRYDKIREKTSGNVTKGDISKFLKRYKETMYDTTKPKE